MKYYKSTRGYFYKVVGDKKIRISMEEYRAKTKKKTMKGGIDRFGYPEERDFSNNGDGEIFNYVNNNSTNYKIKIIRRTLTREPYLFFGLNRDKGEFQYCCLNSDADPTFGNYVPVLFYTKNGIKDRHKTDIFIDKIHINILNNLLDGLKKIRKHKRERDFMTRLYNYLSTYCQLFVRELYNYTNHEG
jgi:hypothetical protein